jgi:sugar lactone lactonase YvrE
MKRTTVYLLLTMMICANLAMALDITDIVASDVEKIDSGFQFIEGPVWHKDGYLLFSDIPAQRIYQYIDGKKSTVWRSNSGKSNGLTFDKQGRLIACEHWNRRVSRTEEDGTIVTLVERYQGKALNSPNDCAVRSDGMIFFTDPDWGLEGRARGVSFKGVYRVMPGEEPVVLVTNFTKPNGICFSPDESILYIADDTNNHIRKFNVSPDGTLDAGSIFAQTENPDGIKCDIQGNLYVTSKDRISPYQGSVAVFDPQGELIGHIYCMEKPANCAFGGDENKTLFITANKGLYKVNVKIPGIDVWARSGLESNALK